MPPSEREALLRREVVDVGLARIERQARGAGGGVDQDQCVAGVAGALDRHHHACGGLVVRPADGVHAVGAVRLGRVARIGADDNRIGQMGRARRDLRELLRELAVGQVERALADEAGGRGVPERGRAAVAERDLVAVG